MLRFKDDASFARCLQSLTNEEEDARNLAMRIGRAMGWMSRGFHRDAGEWVVVIQLLNCVAAR